MIKIQRIKKDTQQSGNIVQTTESIRVLIDNFNIDPKDMSFIERKYQGCLTGHYSNIFFINFNCKSTAKCAPEDKFNFRTGKIIAERRCWNKVKNKTSRILKDILNLQGLKLKEIRDFNANIVYDDMEKVLAEFYNNNQED
jgi:hypothetical protein